PENSVQLSCVQSHRSRISFHHPLTLYIAFPRLLLLFNSFSAMLFSTWLICSWAAPLPAPLPSPNKKVVLTLLFIQSIVNLSIKYVVPRLCITIVQAVQ